VLCRANRLAVVRVVGIGVAIDAGAPTSRVVVALTTVAVVGQDGPEICSRVPIAVSEVRAGAGAGSAPVVKLTHVVSEFMAEGVVSSGAVPGRHGEHVVNARSKSGNTAVLRVVDDERHEVSALLGPQGVNVVHLSVDSALQIIEGSTKGVAACLDVRRELGMN